jgi:aldose 1-epimerase
VITYSLLAICVAMTGFVVATRKLRRRFGLICKTACLSEREQWLAGEFCEQLPQELDFNQPAPLPRQWVNNGFAGWNGQARIEQPQEGYAIIMETTPPAPCYFIFVSDPAFDKGYAFDFFCLEPMSHAPDDHHRPEGGDLIALAPGESTTSEMSLRVEWL